MNSYGCFYFSMDGLLSWKVCSKYPLCWDYFETQMMIVLHGARLVIFIHLGCGVFFVTFFNMDVAFNCFYDLFTADMLWYILFVGG